MPIFNASLAKAVSGGITQPVPAAFQKIGPIVPLQVEIPTALAAQLRATEAQIPSPITGLALIDTGASVSGVDETVVQQLGIQPIGVASISHAGGSQ